MHSSRMRTGRSLTVCCSLLPGGRGSACSRGGVCLVWGGVCLVRGGCLPSLGGVCLVRGDVCPVPRGVCLVPGGVLPVRGGVCLVRGVCLVPGGFSLSLLGGACLETPPVDRITDACKNITLATTSLRPVIIFRVYLKL